MSKLLDMFTCIFKKTTIKRFFAKGGMYFASPYEGEHFLSLIAIKY